MLAIDTPQKLMNRLPLAIVLVIPFTIIIVVVVLFTSYLSYKNSQRVVNDATQEIIDTNTAQIHDQLDTLITTPSQITEISAAIMIDQPVALTETELLSYYLWKIVEHYDTISSIYYGYPDGGLALGGREGPGGDYYFMYTADHAAGPLDKYAIDADGHETGLIFHVPFFDARERHWFDGARATDGVFVSDPYLLSTGQNLAVATSLAIYSPAGDFMGVISIDIFVPHLDEFLANLTIGKNGQAFIVQDTGELVATSTGELLFEQSPDDDWMRIQAHDSNNNLINASGKYIDETFGGFSGIDSTQHESLELYGEQYLLSITPFTNDYDKHWFIVVLVPKSDFVADIDTQNEINSLIAVVAGAIAVLIGMMLVVGVTHPIRQLTDAALAMSMDDWSKKVPVQGVQEVQVLGQAFNRMAVELKHNFNELEQRVVARTAELQASQMRYQAIVEDQTELVCRYNPDNTLNFVNDAYCRYYGKTQEELIGQSFMPLVPTEDQLILNTNLNKISPQNPIVTTEHRAIRDSGEVRWMQWIDRGIFDDEGNLIELQAVGRDITDIKRYQESLQKALERETELNTLKSNFISTVSHEFRTPLTIMMNSTEILDRYHENLTVEKQHKYLQQIETQIEHVTDLLDNVILMNKTEQGRLEIDPQVIDIESLCKRIVHETKLVTAKGLHFDIAKNNDCQTIISDQQLLDLIFSNLISNAAKYSKPSGTIKISLTCEATHFIFKVQDEGIGIPAGAQNAVFEAFYRADNVSTIQGTGLGLAIVKQAVERYGGTIEVKSEVNIGTTFTVRLPNLTLP